MKDRITQLFLQYLKYCNVSEKTLRYYKSDLALFTAWLVFKIKSLGADCENLQEALPFLTNKTAEEYKEFLIKNGNSVQTINRRLSTLRTLSKFLLDNNFLSFNFAKNIKNISKAVIVPPLERVVTEFSNYLEVQKASFLTRKNYLADINQFLRFIEKQGKKDLQEITSKDIKRYLIIELASSPEATKDRKISSLKKFFSWAKEEKKTNINPVEDYLKDTAYIKPIERSLSELTETSINRKVFGNYPSYEGLKARINAYLAGKPRLQKLVYHLLYTRPKWYKAYHSLAISRYLNFAILVIFATGLGFGVYQQLFAKPQTPIAYPSQPVPPKRYLSFQGRLTNQYQTPITTPTNIVFKLYDASTGGNTLWNSAGVACSVDPDEDGIFSILLGTTSGDGYTCTGISPIDSSVFTENSEVWLGIKVGSDPEATPRIQIATVAYALNAETVQGYPIDATGSATKNTILTMNSGGEVVLAEVGPKIKSVSGNFSVQGEAVTIQANGGGVAGDITLSPASDGTVSILASGTTNDSLYIQNAQITSGALIHGYYGGTSTTVDLLKLGAGATESTKFLVESSGDTFIASGADLFIGGIGLNDNSSNSSGASLIGLYDDNMTYISGNTNVQSAIKQLDTAIGTLTGSAGGWTDDGTIVRLTTSTDRVGIGTTSVNSNTKVGVLGGVAIGSQTYSDAQAPTNGLIVEGNVGIGTTAPTAKLDVAGDIYSSANIRANTDLYIAGTALSANTTTTSGASLVGLYDDAMTYISGNTNVQSAIKQLDTAIGTLTGSAGGWTDDGTIVRLTTSTDRVGIGTTSVNSNTKVGVLGGVAIGSQTYSDAQAPTNGLIVEGNVGIGTTAPTAKLDVAGDILVNNGGSIDTRAAGTLTIGGTTQTGLTVGRSGATTSIVGSNITAGGIAYGASNTLTFTSAGTSGQPLLSGGSGAPTFGTLGLVYGGTNANLSGVAQGGLIYKGASALAGTGALTGILQGNGSSAPTAITGTANYVPRWSSSAPYLTSTSTIFDNGTNVGIGTTVPTKGKLNVLGAVAIGSTAYTETSGAAPTNGLIVEGNVGIGTTNPDRQLKIVTSGDTAPGFSVDGSSLTYNEIFELLGTLPTNPSTGRALTVGIATEAYSRGVFYNDGTLGIGPGSSTRDVFLRRSTTNTMMIDSNMSGGAANFVVTGNVGIGTTSPSHKLEVTQSASTSIRSGYFSMTSGTSGTEYIVGQFNVGGSGAQSPAIAISSNNTVGLKLTHSSNFTIGTIDHNYSSATALAFAVRGSEKMRVDNSGNVGIGTPGPGNKLHVNENSASYATAIQNNYSGSNKRGLVIYIGPTTTPATSDVFIAFSNTSNWGFNGSVSGNGSGGVNYNTTSDKRLKTNLQQVNNALNIIKNIEPYYFDFIWAPGKTNIGFMAQDIMDIYPYAVSGDPNSDPLINPMQVDYSKFTPLLLAGIKEQQLQIASQSAQIALLEKDLNLTSTGDLNIAQTQDEDYQVQNSQTGDIITRLSAFAETVMGKIRAGSISAYEITTNGFIAFQAQVDNLLVKTGLVSPSVQTAMISPLADEKDIVIRLGKSATGSDSVQGKLSIQNQNGEEVASINSEGDATFSGTLNSENLAVENNATISGDLTANNINTGEIRAEKLVVDQIVSPSGYNSGITLEQIEELLRQAQADQNLLGQAEDWYNATSSAQIKNLAAETATLKNLFVTQSIAANSLSLSQSISLGTDMVIQSQLIDNKLANSIDTLTAPLSIQSLALAPVEIMAGKIRIETNGDVYIAGNLYVAGRVESTGLTVKTSADMTRTDLVRVEDEAGNLAAGISASGSAQFKELASDKIVIAGASVATDSATLQNGEINTNASAGSGILPAGQKEIAIVSPNIKSESLVYVTPTSDTKNYVLYVKAKEDGRMVVGFNRTLDIDVYFNWWVIEAR